MSSLVYASCKVTTPSCPILTFPLLVPIPSCSQFQLVVRLYELIVTFSCRHFLHTFTAKTCHLRCCAYTPRRLQQTAISCKRSICNKVNEFKKIMPRRIVPNTCTTSPMFNQYLVHLHGDFHWNEESTKNLANSTMKKKKSFAPIVCFVELLLLFFQLQQSRQCLFEVSIRTCLV